MSSPEIRRCPECAAELPASAEGGALCPSCLLRLGLASAEPGDDQTSPPGATNIGPRGAGPSGDDATEPELPAGTRIGHYEIRAPLGAGGMGRVYLAHDLDLRRDVALKLLAPAIAGDPAALSRFRREARALAALKHPGVVTVYSVEEMDGVPFLTMELVEGVTLERVIAPGGMPLEKFLGLSVELARAVAAAHARGIVHRDLKPGNVMLAKGGGIKVLDFGLAKPLGLAPAEISTATQTEQGALLGTVRYMSPEQLQARPIDFPSDVFSLGIVLYEMATGAHPFPSDSLAGLISAILRDAPARLDTRRNQLPHELERIVGRCLEKDPALRYPSAAELAADLERLSRGGAGKESRSRRHFGRTLGVAALLAVALGLGWIALRSEHREEGGGRAIEEPDSNRGRAAIATAPPSRSDPSPTRGATPAPATANERESTSAATAPEPLGRATGAGSGPGREATSSASASSAPSDSSASAGVAPPVGAEAAEFFVEARLFRQRGGGAERLVTGSRVAPGDELFLDFHASRALFVYVLNEDELGQVHVLFPLAGGELANPLAGGTHRLPGTRSGKALSWQVSTPGEEEHLLVIASPHRLDALELALAEIPQASGRAPVYARLPEPAVSKMRGIGGLVERPGGESGPSDRLSSRVLRLVDGRESAEGVWIRKIDLENPVG